MKYLYPSLLGLFIFDNQFNLVEEMRFKDLKDYQNKTKFEEKFQQKYRDIKAVPEDKLEKVLAFLKDKKYFPAFYLQNLALTRQKLQNSPPEDLLVIQAISSFEELNKALNLLAKRLREWYAWYLPELGESLADNEKFAELLIKRNKKELLKELHVKESFGLALKEEDVAEIQRLGEEILGLYQLRREHEAYLKKLMARHCPNLLELAGPTLGAKLIELGKGLKHLALLPASTLQLLGAEKALFRHLKTGAKSPKHGIIVNHPFVQKARKEKKGKAARLLADKLSLCARLDYFKGGFKAKEYKKELEEAFNKF